METVYYTLGAIAAVCVIIAAIVVAMRALALMAHMEDTRRDLAALIAEGMLSIQHLNRFLAHSQEGMDRLRHTLDRLERVLSMLQPATTVGGWLAGARRMLTGRRPQDEPSQSNQVKETEHD